MPLTGQSITLIILLRRMYAKASALLVSLLHPGSIAWERVGARTMWTELALISSERTSQHF